MSGNAAEWTRGAYVYGGSWQSGEDGSRCDSHVQLQKGRKYFYAGSDVANNFTEDIGIL